MKPICRFVCVDCLCVCWTALLASTAAQAAPVGNATPGLAQPIRLAPPKTEAEVQFAQRLVEHDMRDWEPRPTPAEVRFEAQHMAVARVDLDGDGRPDALFIPHLACGYWGCAVYAAVRGPTEWTYHELCKLVKIEQDIEVLPDIHHGLHDLRVGGQNFRFDGRQYCLPKADARGPKP